LSGNQTDTPDQGAGSIEPCRSVAGAADFVSPFIAGSGEDWQWATDFPEIPDGGAKFCSVDGAAVILSRVGRVVTSFRDHCAHLGLSLAAGRLSRGCLTCPPSWIRV
jgi:hypothetical protein